MPAVPVVPAVLVVKKVPLPGGASVLSGGSASSGGEKKDVCGAEVRSRGLGSGVSHPPPPPPQLTPDMVAEVCLGSAVPIRVTVNWSVSPVEREGGTCDPDSGSPWSSEQLSPQTSYSALVAVCSLELGHPNTNSINH